MSQAAVYLMFSTLLFTSLNILVKFLPHLPTSQIVLLRSLVSLALCYWSLRWMKLSPWGKNKKVLILRGVLGTLALYSLFYCLHHMPLAMAMTFSNMSPLFTVLIAHFILKEKVHPFHVLFLLLAFCGVVLVKGWDPSVSWGLAMVGILTAVFAAGAYTSVRLLKESDHAMVVVFYFPLMSVPMMIPVAATEWVPLTIIDVGLLLLIGLLTQGAQYFMTRAYQMEKASAIMIYNYSGILWAVLTGWWLFEEKFAPVQLIGLAMIFFCLVGATGVTDWQRRRLTSRVSK